MKLTWYLSLVHKTTASYDAEAKSGEAEALRPVSWIYSCSFRNDK